MNINTAFGLAALSCYPIAFVALMAGFPLNLPGTFVALSAVCALPIFIGCALFLRPTWPGRALGVLAILPLLSALLPVHTPELAELEGLYSTDDGVPALCFHDGNYTWLVEPIGRRTARSGKISYSPDAIGNEIDINGCTTLWLNPVGIELHNEERTFLTRTATRCAGT